MSCPDVQEMSTPFKKLSQNDLVIALIKWRLKTLHDQLTSLEKEPESWSKTFLEYLLCALRMSSAEEKCLWADLLNQKSQFIGGRTQDMNYIKKPAN